MKKLTKLLILMVLIIIVGIYVFNGLLDMGPINENRNTLSFAQESLVELKKSWQLDDIHKEDLNDWYISEIGWQGDKEAYYVLEETLELNDYMNTENEDIEAVFNSFYSRYEMNNRINFEKEYHYKHYTKENIPLHDLYVVYQEGFIYILERIV